MNFSNEKNYLLHLAKYLFYLLKCRRTYKILDLYKRNAFWDKVKAVWRLRRKLLPVVSDKATIFKIKIF